jgi:putative ABC transport system permease protein
VPVLPRLAALWRNLLHRRRVERELDDELRSTLGLLVDAKLRQGMRPEDARRAAAIELGGLSAVKQQIREAKAGSGIESLLQDLRYGGRALRRSPGFTLTAVLSLGVGLAGVAVVFGLADAYLLRHPRGLADPARLAEVGRLRLAGGDPGEGPGFNTFSYPNFRDYRDRQTVFDGLAAYHLGGLARFGFGTGQEAVPVLGAYVSANYFEVLGVPIARGRGFAADDERLDQARAVVVISHRLWEAQFNGAADVIGRTVRLNGRPFTVIGVASRDFAGYGLEEQRMWVPLTAYPDGDDLKLVGSRGRQWLMGIGRLKPGVGLEQARDQMARIAADLAREFPDDNTDHGLGVEPTGMVPVDGRATVYRFVALLFALVGLVMLIACFTTAGLLLARGVTRAPELGLRLALGAARARVVRLLVIESLMIALAAAAVAVALSWVGTSVLVDAIPTAPNRNIQLAWGLDWRVVAFLIALSTVVGLVCGLVPAWTATRPMLASALSRERGGSAPRLRARAAFVVAQVALSVLLVVCALLLTRSMRHAAHIDPGFRMDGLEVVGIDLRLGGYDAPRGRILAEELMRRVESLPGVRAAGSARVVPLTREREGGRFWLPGEFGPEKMIDGSQNIVTPGFFDALGLPLLAGRRFAPTDRLGAPAVTLVNETLARQMWPGQDAVGKKILVGRSRWSLDVIGVVKDAKYRTIGETPSPFFYVPAALRYEPVQWIVLRPKRGSVIADVRAIVRGLDPNLPVTRAGTFADLTAFTLFPQRLVTWLAAIVAVTGVFLAALGVYGIAAYHASLRTREIGIRIALGAGRGQAVRLVLRQIGWLAVTGIALGLTAAATVTNLLEGMLYGVRPLDPVSFVGAALVLGSLAVVAGLIPARRAASVNPVDALRAQ